MRPDAEPHVIAFTVCDAERRAMSNPGNSVARRAYAFAMNNDHPIDDTTTHVTRRRGQNAGAAVGIPGTGLSYTQDGERGRPERSPYVDPEPSAGITWRGWLMAAFVLCIFIGAPLNGGK